MKTYTCNKNNKALRWIYLGTGTLVMLFAGVIYAWTILKAPLAEEFGFSSTTLTVNYTLTFCFFCAGGITNGRVRSKIKLWIRLITGGFLVLLGFFLASRMQSAGMLYLGYGILGGFGIGVIYNNIVSELTLWFPERQGLCSGVLMMGFGASAMLLGNAIQIMIEKETILWRGTYIILGMAIFLAAIIAAIVIRPAEAGTKDAGGNAGLHDDANLRPSQMVRTGNFWRVFLRAICIGSSGGVIINFSRELSLSLGATVALATTVVGLLSICNGIGRLVIGFLFDILKYKKTLWLSNILSVLGLALNLFAYLSTNVTIFVIGAIVTGLAYGAATTIASAITADFFGAKYFSQNFSVMNITLVVSSIVSICCSLLLDHFGRYLELLLLLAAMMILGCILTFFIKKESKPQSNGEFKAALQEGKQEV